MATNALAPKPQNALIAAYQRYIGQPAAQLLGGGIRGYFGLDVPSYATDLGREAYRNAQALSNAPGVGAPAGAFKAAAKFAPEAAMFIGAMAKTWDRASNAKAVELEKAGVNSRAIWSETGNWRGPDGNWRQEISDEAARYVGAPQGAAAREALQHPQLTAAYPDVMQTPVYTNPTTDTSKFQQDRIDLGLMGAQGPKSTLLHEVQHGIQQQEGFARGGNPETVRLATLGDVYPPTLMPIIDEYRDLWRSLKGQERPKTPVGLSMKSTDIDDYYDAVDDLKDPELRKKFTAILDKIDVERQNLWGFDEGIMAQKRDYDAYKRLAGEAEARATQSRMNLTPAQRRALFPEESYDVPLNELIIRR
jgi:hypothetical protein